MISISHWGMFPVEGYEGEAENRKLRAAIVGITIALSRDDNLDAGVRLAIDVRDELKF